MMLLLINDDPAQRVCCPLIDAVECLNREEREREPP